MSMTKILKISTLITFTSLLYSQQALAKPNYPSLQPSAYNNAIGCTSCHSGSPQTENNVGQPYGRTFDNLIDNDFLSAQSYTSLEKYDSDGDGFSNGQEIYGGSSFNDASTPQLTGNNPKVSLGTVSATAATNETITLATPTTNVTPALPAAHKNIGGTIDVTMTNLVSGTANNAGTATFMFSTGGMLAGGTVAAYDAAGTATALKPILNTNGSATVLLTDESAYDTYSQAAYIAAAKLRTPATGINLTKDPYATVSPLAVIGDNVTINAYAQVGAYAQIGNGVLVDQYAVVDDYAEVATTVSQGFPASIPSTFKGTVKTRLGFTTAVPAIPAGQGGDNDGNDSDGGAGGLHCMTTGFNTTAMMLLMLLGFGFLLRRQAVKKRI